MATLLKNMKLTSVDLVGRGANQEADICLFKGMDADPAEATKVSGAISKSDPNRFDHIEEFP
jgi:hypothetical protein